MKKNVVITGAGSGLGASLAIKYSELGYQVCLLGRHKDKLTAIANSLKNKAFCYSLDVSSKQQVTNVFRLIEKEVGHIDILVNSAGTGHFHLAEDIIEDSIHSMIDVNLKGTIFCTQAVLTEMKKRNSGTIINIISTAGLEGKATESVYCASKFGVRGFTESLVLETNQTDIFVCGIYMGGMQTEFWNGIFDETKTVTFMNPEDVADVIVSSTNQKLIPSEIVIKSKKK